MAPHQSPQSSHLNLTTEIFGRMEEQGAATENNDGLTLTTHIGSDASSSSYSEESDSSEDEGPAGPLNFVMEKNLTLVHGFDSESYITPIGLPARANVTLKKRREKKQKLAVKRDIKVTDFPCRICTANGSLVFFSAMRTLLGHLKKKHRFHFDSEGPQECFLCTRPYKSRASYLKHLNSAHPNLEDEMKAELKSRLYVQLEQKMEEYVQSIRGNQKEPFDMQQGFFLPTTSPYNLDMVQSQAMIYSLGQEQIVPIMDQSPFAKEVDSQSVLPGFAGFRGEIPQENSESQSQQSFQSNFQEQFRQFAQETLIRDCALDEEYQPRKDDTVDFANTSSEEGNSCFNVPSAKKRCRFCQEVFAKMHVHLKERMCKQCRLITRCATEHLNHLPVHKYFGAVSN